MQAFISSIGDPSLVTSPLNSLIATSLSFLLVGGFQVPLDIIPEAPSPRRCCTERDDQVMSSRIGLSSKDGAQGFPANERNESSGRENSQVGNDVRLFDESRRRPSFRQCAISAGRDVRRFPASMHF